LHVSVTMKDRNRNRSESKNHETLKR